VHGPARRGRDPLPCTNSKVLVWNSLTQSAAWTARRYPIYALAVPWAASPNFAAGS
jgi:hypothetical protein